jgi:hypothetical protein
VRLRLAFCAAVAVIAASLADPLVEFASNAGVFGSGNYTDHSNFDVLPALLAGFGLLALYFVRRAPAILSGRALCDNVATLLPAIFALQIAMLYLMESAEQTIVWGHTLGPSIWLGAPLPMSLTIHAVVAICVLYALVRAKRTLAVTTLRLVRFVLSIVRLPAAGTRPLAIGATCLPFKQSYLALCTLGERAPPA